MRFTRLCFVQERAGDAGCGDCRAHPRKNAEAEPSQFKGSKLHADSQRETIFVKDLLHGRNFTCESVVELARKEAWLEGACGVFRQVMESAKHWDGVERHTIEPLPKEQAKELILRAA